MQADENSISALPSNFFVNNLLATMAITNDKPTAKKILCDNCDNEDAVAKNRCNECGIFLCQYCTEFHKRSRSTKQHRIYTMEDLKSSIGAQNVAEKVRCSKHKEEVMKLFCKTCQTTICRDCTIVDHRTHEYDFIEEVAVEEKKYLESKLNEVKQRKDRVAQGLVNLDNFNKRLNERYASTTAEINEHFDELANAVESRRKELLEKASTFTKLKQKQIAAQSEVLEMALASCESSIEFTEQAFKNGNDTQILSMEKYILQSLDQLKAVKDQTNPCVTENMVLIIPASAPKAKETLLNEFDVDVTDASPDYCQTSFTGDERVFHSGKQYSISLICNDENNQRLRYGNQIIKPSFPGLEVTDVAVTDNKDGSYNIAFCPRQVGMLKFEVSINGIPAPKCSLTKQVEWALWDAYGNGAITNDGLTMNGGQGYCRRLGYCCFESGIHIWKVQVSCEQNYDYEDFNDGYFDDDYTVEVGIIDYEEITKNVLGNQKKWVESSYVDYNENISLTLDMENKTLMVEVNSSYDGRRVNTYKFNALRVLPFFACYSPNISISLQR